MKMTKQRVMSKFLCTLLCFTLTQGTRDRELLQVQIVTNDPNPINLGPCQGDCDNDSHCQGGLYCFQRGSNQGVPFCSGGEYDSSRTDYCVHKEDPLLANLFISPQPTESSTQIPSSHPTDEISCPHMPGANPLYLIKYTGDFTANLTPFGRCEGHCESDTDCAHGLRCFERNPFDPVPCCYGGHSDSSHASYCTFLENDTSQPTSSPSASPSSKPTGTVEQYSAGILTSYGGSPPLSKFPLGLCEGDCDNDSHCQTGLKCFQRGNGVPVPGCIGTDNSPTDYCVNPKAIDTPDSVNNYAQTALEYTPGKLTVYTAGLMLSEGLDARIIATGGQNVAYGDGTESSIPFHFRPDAGATFPDNRPNNEGGWIYVSNSEMPETAEGGAGALTFDKDGNILDYKMVLKSTTMNCGGGRTPWNTWVSCEEVERTGQIYQVDPTGQREPQLMTLGSDGGRWESFAYDIRDSLKPHFFVTEDHHKGTLRRFTPESPGWNNPWNMLHGPGTTDFLMLTPNANNDGGTFIWTNDKTAAKYNAKAFYPQSEGIDILDNQLFFVCKRIKQIFTLNLDDQTYSNQTTTHGLFDGGPDQMQRLLNDPSGLLYFTEEGGVDAGVHARDPKGNFYTIFESPVYTDETTGLSFSPDGRFMYVAYQVNGLLFAIWRKDGLGFHNTQLDLKFHQAVS